MKTLETLKFIGRIRSNKNRQRGFTLIELVVVLAVLGVLAAIGIPQLTGLQQTAELRGISTNLASEAGNIFAQDLASGAIGNGSSDGTIDWSGPCGALDGENSSTTDPVLPSTEDLPGSWEIDDGTDGEYGFSVPTFDGDDITEGTTCYLVDGS